MSMTALDPSAGGSAARSTRGTTPLFFPKLNGAEVDITVNEMTLTMTEGQHDAANLTCISTTLEDTEGFLDSAFSFYWGVPPRTELFQGYVTDVTEEQASQGTLSFKLSLLGPTKVMVEGQPRFWSNKSVTAAARDITGANRLGFGGHANTFAWTAIAQTEESDWAMVNRLTRRAGWMLIHRYGVVLMYEPTRLYREAGTYTRLVSGLDDLGSTDRNMLSFEAVETSKLLHSNLGTKMGYFTTSNGVQTISQSGDYLGYRFETGLVLRNQTEAEQHLKAFDVTHESWENNGIARIWGDADIWPGMVVDVRTSNTRYLTNKNDGRWLVRGVGHQGNRQQFQTLLYLTRPKRIALPSDVIYKPFWEEEQTTPRSKPKLTLQEKRWLSTWREGSAAA